MEILDTREDERRGEERVALWPMFLAAARWPPAASSAMRVHPIVRKFAKRHAENQITIKWAEEGTARAKGMLMHTSFIRISHHLFNLPQWVHKQ